MQSGDSIMRARPFTEIQGGIIIVQQLPIKGREEGGIGYYKYNSKYNYFVRLYVWGDG